MSIRWSWDLQRFADEPAADPTATITQTSPADPPAPSDPTGQSSASGSDPGQGSPAPARVSFTPEQQAELDRIVRQRLGEDRQRRGGRSAAPTQADPWTDFGRQIEQLPEGDRVRAEIQEVVNRYAKVDPITGAQRMLQSFEQRTELRLAESELRAADPVFRQHETDIKDWAEENGIAVDSPAQLRMATLAWKGSNATQLAAQAQVEAQRAAQQVQQNKAAGALVGGGTTRQPAPDPKGMSDAEWLRTQGLKYLRE